jgi:hypothetical protein
MRSASQLGLIVIGVLYGDLLKLMPAMQQWCQARWKGSGLERGWWPVGGAVIVGILVLVVSIAAAAGAIGHTGTALRITVASAASFSSSVSAMFGESLEALLALCMGPLESITEVASSNEPSRGYQWCSCGWGHLPHWHSRTRNRN